MSSPSRGGPRRQSSTISSTSSGNRTIRAGDTSSPISTASGLFAKLTGRRPSTGREAEEELDDEDAEVESPSWGARVSAGPSDYWRRPASPSPVSSDEDGDGDIEGPPSGWRTLSDTPLQAGHDPEQGPSEYWRRPSPTLSPQLLPPRTPSKARPPKFISTPDQVDKAEYEKRLAQILSNGDIGESPVVEEYENGDEGVGFTSPANGIGNGYDAAYRQVLGIDEEKNSIAEDEFGVLEFPVRDDNSDRAPSTSSISFTTPFKGPKSINGNWNGMTPSPAKRTPYLHPTVSRLRSHLRTTSSSTQQSLSSQPPNLAHHRAASHFSQISISRSESFSTVSAAGRPQLATPVDAVTPEKDISKQGPAFTFHPLRQLSSHLFSKKGSGTASPIGRKAGSILGIQEEKDSFGKPTVLDVRGMVAVGTESGWVLVYGFGQELKCLLGSESIAAASGPVTAVTISPDQTYIAVGHATGNIHLYDLKNPSKSARTAAAVTLPQVLSGRKEGHLQQCRILHIGFVGVRHTSIVSGDEEGRAFWWSLGKVMGVESNDVVRMLGSYPEKDASAKPKRPTTLFAVLPLPLGEKSHSTDTFSLSALLTPVKLVIVGMRPSPKTWFRKMRENSGGDLGGLVGCAAWLRSGEVEDQTEKANGNEVPVSDPVLAYSWGSSVRFLRVRTTVDQGEETPGAKDDLIPEFVQGKKYEAPHAVKALLWYDSNVGDESKRVTMIDGNQHVLLITVSEIILLDVRTMLPVETTPLQTRLLTSQDNYAGLGARRARVEAVPESLGGSVRTYRGKLFLLTKTNLQVGTLLSWRDRVLQKVQQGDFLAAIQLALAYYQGKAPGNVIGLSEDKVIRRDEIGARIKELLQASLRWAFSEDRMKDDTHYSSDGRGVDLTSLFEGLATCCIEACEALDDLDYLFDSVYEHFASAGIQSMFLARLEPYVFDGRLNLVPPTIIQALISMHDERSELDLAEAVIWHVDPAYLDINQAITLCEKHGLWDALIHVYTRAMRDYVAPIAKLLGVVREVYQHRQNRPSLVGIGDHEDDQVEHLAPDAYKLYAYLENVLSGLSYPSGNKLSESEGNQAKAEVYGFLFSGSAVAWPLEGQLISTTHDAEPPFPYLTLLLRFDTEAFLHSMDIAFEDSFLNDRFGTINRQSIVNLMLDVMTPDDFHSSDITLLHIFVARNLPKYPQFLHIPPSTLHRILVSLSSDPDQSTREDRQLAAEYLLSAYTPHDENDMLELFEQAGFFRILRTAYKRKGRWADLVTTFLNDPECDDEIFDNLNDIIQSSSTSPTVVETIQEVLPQLFDQSVRRTALLVDHDLPQLHPKAIALLDGLKHKQLAYLRCLLQPSHPDEDGPPIEQTFSTKLDFDARHRYVRLLCQCDPVTLVGFLDERGPSFFDLDRLGNDCAQEGLYEAQLWALDRQGKTKETFDTVARVLGEKGNDLGEALLSSADASGAIHVAMDTLQSVSRMAVRLCREHSTGKIVSPDVEDMWFGVLHEMVDLVHSMPQTPREHGAEVMDTLRSLVQETLASLVSSSSPSLSFPRLFKRLVEASTGGNGNGRAYSEFRTILSGMLDSYRAEGDMLAMTIRLVEADLFVNVDEMVRARQKGWRPGQGVCGVCGEGLFREGKQASGISEGDKDVAVVVLGSGRTLHRGCVRKSGETIVGVT
ncbi:vacuolar protein sorting-associated protein 8, partial [Tremellales sp. Uapishka_1]